MVKERPALTVDQWLASVRAERKDAINSVRDAVNERLPEGYGETVDWAHARVGRAALHAAGHAQRSPLMLAALGAHTKVMTICLMTVYGDPKIRNEFETAYKQTGKRARRVRPSFLPQFCGRTRHRVCGLPGKGRPSQAAPFCSNLC